ncbi:MAG: HAMP domain-containing sensor histidine kinase [Christensenella sp.]|nr:HAMP domain-containing sensor histidine kinase [Christensenella sp.]
MKLRTSNLKKASIKWKIFTYILIFAAVLILLLWLFQIVFLDDFYQSIKQNEIKDAAQTIEDNTDNENIQILMDMIAHRYDVCVRITDLEGTDVYSSELTPDCVIHKMPTYEMSILAQETQNAGGTLMRILPRQQVFDKGYNAQHFKGNVPPMNAEITESLIYSKIIEGPEGQQWLLSLNSVITPVTSTVETLRIQLIYITVILVGCALIIALVISRRVSKPIIRINQSAKKLAKAEYDVHFDDTGYREISELADTLNYAAHELSKVESLRRELIANISHDLRTPLTMITGYAEVMRDIPGENTPENIQIIIDEAKRLTTLVNDVMDISKLQSGTQELRPSEFNLTALIRDILKRYTKLTEQEGFVITLESDRDITVTADEIKLSQVIYNLINNAVNYAGDGRRIVVKQILEADAVRIEVQDDGEGIPEDKLAYIWDRYYKVDKTHKRAAIGTGLGLSIVKGILDLHHARYGVISHMGEGSTFWFELPLNP